MSMLSVVIPAYNEEDSINSVIKRVEDVTNELMAKEPELSDVEILVVNDGSTDRTVDQAHLSQRARIVSHETNRGYGAALKTGFLQAKGDILAFLDADGTYPPEYLGTLCTPILRGTADMAVANRERGTGTGMPIIRRIGNEAFARFLAWIVERPVKDSATGMRAFRRSLLPRLLPQPDGLDFIVGLSTRALHENLAVFEMQIPYAEREGRSKLSVVRDGLRFIRTFIRIAVTYDPLKFFGAAGLFALAVAGYLGVAPVSYYVRFQRVEDWEIYRLFTILVLAIIGLQLINFGILGNRLVALVSHVPADSRSILGRLLLNHGLSLTSWKVGVSLCFGAVVLNHTTVVQYLTLRSIYVHWSYIITGATLFLVGAQLIMTGALLGVFRMLEERRAYLLALDSSGRIGDVSRS